MEVEEFTTPKIYNIARQQLNCCSKIDIGILKNDL